MWLSKARVCVGGGSVQRTGRQGVGSAASATMEERVVALGVLRATQDVGGRASAPRRAPGYGSYHANRVPATHIYGTCMHGTVSWDHPIYMPNNCPSSPPSPSGIPHQCPRSWPCARRPTPGCVRQLAGSSPAHVLPPSLPALPPPPHCPPGRTGYTLRRVRHAVGPPAGGPPNSTTVLCCSSHQPRAHGAKHVNNLALHPPGRAASDHTMIAWLHSPRHIN